MIVRVNARETGKRIKQKMMRAGMRAKQLKGCMGYKSDTTVYRWCRGEKLPGLDDMVMLAHVLKVTINDLIVTEEVDDEEV